MHVHSKGRPVRVVVIMEIVNQSIVPGCCVPRWIATIHHGSACSIVFVHDINIRNLPEPWVGHLWARFFLGRTGLGRHVVHGIGVHWVTPIKGSINRPGEVISEFTRVQGPEHVLGEHKFWRSKSSYFSIGYICKSTKQSYIENAISVELT